MMGKSEVHRAAGYTPGYERRSYLTSAKPDGMFAVMAPPKKSAFAKSGAMTLGSDFPMVKIGHR